MNPSIARGVFSADEVSNKERNLAIGIPGRRRFLRTMIATAIMGYTAGFMDMVHALAPRTRTAGPGVRTWKEIFLGLLGETFVVVSEDRKKKGSDEIIRCLRRL